DKVNHRVRRCYFPGSASPKQMPRLCSGYLSQVRCEQDTYPSRREVEAHVPAGIGCANSVEFQPQTRRSTMRQQRISSGEADYTCTPRKSKEFRLSDARRQRIARLLRPEIIQHGPPPVGTGASDSRTQVES